MNPLPDRSNYSGTSLIRTSLNRNLANPNGKVLVNFFFCFFFVVVVVVVAILTYYFSLL